MQVRAPTFLARAAHRTIIPATPVGASLPRAYADHGSRAVAQAAPCSCGIDTGAPWPRSPRHAEGPAPSDLTGRHRRQGVKKSKKPFGKRKSPTFCKSADAPNEQVADAAARYRRQHWRATVQLAERRTMNAPLRINEHFLIAESRVSTFFMHSPGPGKMANGDSACALSIRTNQPIGRQQIPSAPTPTQCNLSCAQNRPAHELSKEGFTPCNPGDPE
ncbi:hypothetical protein FQR65_LT20139 [Abscondita terminalis]|nr:hypothetical protein FQR65_LT20139 [Abscondita terminalis]